MIKRVVVLFFILLSLQQVLSAQELRCNLTINSASVEGTNKNVFTTLEQDLRSFMDSYRFTDLVYADNERIECNFAIIVRSVEDDLFRCELQVQASRPVYGSSYTTSIVNIRDEEFNFRYKEFDPIEINNNTFESNLTAVMAYYAYLIIGFDLDSYQRLGGQSAFAIAEQIVNMSQSRSDASEGEGWMAFDKPRNRYGMINNLMDDRFKKLREYSYEYHRLALDNMMNNVDNARVKIAEGLPVLRELNRLYPSAPLILSFLDAKNDELINIFKGKGSQTERESVHDVLVSVNPTLSNRYDEILK